MVKILGIAVAGGFGALSRYGLHAVVSRFAGESFPWGTLVVNVLGCFLLGLLAELGQYRYHWSAEWRLIAFTGFMGSFTTFSTFALDTGGFMRTHQYGLALANLLAHNVIGVAALLGGLALARQFTS